MKEKIPPPNTNTNLTRTDASESGGTDSMPATMSSQENNNSISIGGGQISFTASYSTEESSITTHGYYCLCYYCDYKADSKDNYEAHIVLRHKHCIAYPNKAEIEKRGLKAQGKDWKK
jgi:hypothetical protein